MTVVENPCAETIGPGLIAEYRSVATSIISDNLDRLPGSFGLVPYHGDAHLVGTALTVRTRAGDNLAIHTALRFARPGDVLVVDGDGDPSRALIGEIIATHAQALGVAGFVIDGAIRDVAALRALALPCYARAVTHRGPYKNGPGELNVPVTVGGMIVRPGDLVVGDADGIVALAPDVAARLLPAVRVQEAAEAEKLRGLRGGAVQRRA